VQIISLKKLQIALKQHWDTTE